MSDKAEDLAGRLVNEFDLAIEPDDLSGELSYWRMTSLLAKKRKKERDDQRRLNLKQIISLETHLDAAFSALNSLPPMVRMSIAASIRGGLTANDTLTSLRDGARSSRERLTRRVGREETTTEVTAIVELARHYWLLNGLGKFAPYFEDVFGDDPDVPLRNPRNSCSRFVVEAVRHCLGESASGGTIERAMKKVQKANARPR